MKKILSILICVLSVFCVDVYAAKKKTTKKSTKNTVVNTIPAIVEGKEPVKVYVFTKESCPYCEKAKAYLNELSKDFGAYYDVVVLEVYDSGWKVKNRNYETLMKQIGQQHGKEVSGVPYIVIGKTYDANEWDEREESSTGAAIKAQILKEYVNEEYEDIVAPALTEIQKTDPHAHDGIIIAGICVVIIGIVGAVVYFGRKEN